MYKTPFFCLLQCVSLHAIVHMEAEKQHATKHLKFGLYALCFADV